jgi:hypothetical protein
MAICLGVFRLGLLVLRLFALLLWLRLVADMDMLENAKHSKEEEAEEEKVPRPNRRSDDENDEGMAATRRTVMATRRTLEQENTEDRCIRRFLVIAVNVVVFVVEVECPITAPMVVRWRVEQNMAQHAAKWRDLCGWQQKNPVHHRPFIQSCLAEEGRTVGDANRWCRVSIALACHSVRRSRRTNVIFWNIPDIRRTALK